MSDYTTTTNLNLKKPAIGGSSDKWGEYLNENMETIGTSIVNLQNASTSRSLESLSNVLDATPTTGQLLQYDTAAWKAATVTIPDNIQDLTNVTVTSPSDGQVLAWSSSNSRWENQTPGAATIPDGTITNAKLDTSLQGQIALILQTTGTPTDNQVLQYNSTSTNWEFVDLPGGNISTLSDTDVSSVSLGNALMYNASGNWEARDLVIADVTNLQTTLDTKLESSDLSSYVTSTSLTTTLGSYVTSTTLATELADYTETSSLALGTLNNVTNTSLATNDFLVYDAVDGAWENQTPTNARTALGLGTIATQDSDDVTISGGSISGIVDLAIADGGTGASSVSAARTNLGLGALATQDTITESQISDLQSYITASSTDTLTNKSGNISMFTNDSGYLTAETNDLSNVSGTLAIANGGTGLAAIGTANQVLAVNSGATALEFQTISITESQISDLQSYLTAETNDLSASVTWANVPDANITQSSVTQHQAALSITESQISDLQTYLTASSTATLTNKSGNISQWTNDSGYLTSETNNLSTVSGTLGTANGGTGVTALSSLNAADLGSNNGTTNATDGYVLTADGTGGTVWEAATGGLSDVVSDTTPQLGGNLDVNGNSIVSASAGNISITPDTTGKIILDGLSWPTSDGSADQVLKTDGAGNLSFVDQSGGGLSDGDKGDITVSGSGGTWTIDNTAVSYAKIQNVSATDKILGRSTAGAGSVEEITCTSAGRALLDDADASAQRTTLGLGTIATQAANSVNIEGGAIDGTTVGATTPAVGTFTTFTSTGIDDNASSTALTIDSSGNVGVGATSLTNKLTVNSSAFGQVVDLQKSGTTYGSLIIAGGYPGIAVGSTAGLAINPNSVAVVPATSSGELDNTLDLGRAGARWDDVYATNATIQTSDANEKDNITTSDLSLDFIRRLNPVSYRFIGKTRTHYGLIAQEIESLLSTIGKETTDFAGFIKTPITDEEGNETGEYRYGLRYHEFISPMIKAIQEQQAFIESQQSQIDALTARIEALEAAP